MRAWLAIWFRPAPRAPAEPLSPEAIAVMLVVMVAAEIADALSRGEPVEAIRDRIVARDAADWRERHGDEAAAATVALLERCGPAAFLTPYGAELAGLLPRKPTRGNADPPTPRHHWRR